jgi:hypothetical protein
MYNDKHKLAIYKWRASNHSKLNEYQKNLQKKYDNWKRISKIFRNILL